MIEEEKGRSGRRNEPANKRKNDKGENERIVGEKEGKKKRTNKRTCKQGEEKKSKWLNE